MSGSSENTMVVAVVVNVPLWSVLHSLGWEQFFTR